MQIKDVINFLNELAPPALQESYDNAGLIVGDSSWECTGVLVCLDSIEAIIDEAIDKKCNLVVAHHPIVFSGLKKINGKNYMERTIIKAIKNDIAIFAIHTNLDNVKHGVNKKFAEKIGLKNLKILAPKKNLLNKITVFCPNAHVAAVQEELFLAGAGRLGNYDSCSFNTPGQGTFRALKDATPFVGEKGKFHTEKETKIEVIVPTYLTKSAIKRMLEVHPYEEVAYDVISLSNSSEDIGAGMLGELDEPVESLAFLKALKSKMSVKCIKHTRLAVTKIKKVAICGGSGSFLLEDAINQQADIFITGDFKYHQFFDADGRIIIADIGHYESEFYTCELLHEKLKEKFSKFAVHLTKKNTNPVIYL